MVFYLLLPPIREMVVDWPRIDILCFLECYKTNYTSQESTPPNPNYFDHKTQKLDLLWIFLRFKSSEARWYQECLFSPPRKASAQLWKTTCARTLRKTSGLASLAGSVSLWKERQVGTPPKFDSEFPLKNGGWKTILSLRRNFSGAIAVSFTEGSILNCTINWLDELALPQIF